MSGVAQPQTPPEEPNFTIDELVRQRASSYPDTAIIAYPSENGEFMDYTYQQLDQYAYQAALHYRNAIKPRSGSDEPVKVVGILGPSDIDYLITTLALTKLGMTVLFLSTRISHAAYKSLIEATGCKDLLVGRNLQKKAQSLAIDITGLNVYTITGSETYGSTVKQEMFSTAMNEQFDTIRENLNNAWIIHSSGSTGLPKPIYQTHAAALRNYANNFGMRGFITLPLYHAHGISSVFRAIHSRQQIHIYPASLPLTGSYLLDTMQRYQFEIFYGVPYALKLLSEIEKGFDVLRKMKLVMFGGSSCPDVLGDKLVKNGVKLISHYGTTETGQLMTSFRDEDDLDWNYLRVSKSLQPFIRWEKRGEDLFELVVLDGWPSKVATNRTDGSYATKDLFSQHPTKPNAFKWAGRLDDTLVLLNGEKAIPIPIEHTVRENAYVSESVVFGAGKPQLGLFIIPSVKAHGMEENELLEAIAPSVNAANSEQPAFAQIAPEMIRVLPGDLKYPRTDKDTVIRAAFYNQLKDEIEKVYEEALSHTGGGEDLEPDVLLAFLRSTILDIMKIEDERVLQDGTDFFALGMDSLQALRIHSAIIKKFNTNSRPVTQNVVFEHPTLASLTRFLHCLRTGQELIAESAEKLMQKLLHKYSTFRPHTPGTADGPNAVLITGATGSLGAHVVAKLVKMPNISIVYCLVRAPSLVKANARVIASLHQRKVWSSLSIAEQRKIVPLPSDLGVCDLGLGHDILEKMREQVSLVIHLAWAVNFNMGVESFEKQHIGGAHNLIQFCLDSKQASPAAFYFGSSVSATARSHKAVEEKTELDFTKAQGMGYAQSKLVTENICARAVSSNPGLVARVLRIGQIAGDCQHGVWNDSEAIPLMLQSAVTIGAIPALDETPTWLPVDVVAQSIIELTGVPASDAAPDSVFHVVNPTTFHWTHDLIPAMRAAGLDFEQVSQRSWVNRLRESNPDPIANPPFKLVEFFASKYDRDDKRPALYYKTDLACSYSPALHSAPRINTQLVSKFITYWQTERWNKRPKSARNDMRQTILVVGGACGTGKTTVSQALSAAFRIPWIDADTLHTPEAICKMGQGQPLDDADRWSWLERVKRKVLGESASVSIAASEANTPVGVVVACSVLCRKYRDRLRDVPDDVDVRFLMLDAGAEELLDRLDRRVGHYMKKDMVQSQLDILEPLQNDELDAMLLDVEKSKEVVVEEAVMLAEILGLTQRK